MARGNARSTHRHRDVLIVHVAVSPEELTAAAQRLNIIQSNVSSANLAAAASTTGVAPAASDELSSNLADLFSSYAEQFHAVVEQTGVSGISQFAQHSTAAANSYATTDVSSAVSMTENQVESLLLLVVGAGAFVLLSPIFLPVGGLVLLAFVLAPI